MTSISNIYSYKDLSLCVYIGNTISIDDEVLLKYCSYYGKINICSFKNEKFCDFHIIEFSNYDQLQKFLNVNIHEINRIKLDVKLYKHILINDDILNLDRKFFIGPILNSNDVNIIEQFYKTIDPTLHYVLSKQDKEKYLLVEFKNRQTILTIFNKQTIPITNENRKFSIHKPIHPKQFLNKIISIKNKRNQIYIHGLKDNITETILIEYFHKYAPVIGCHIFLNHSKYAIMEFNDEKTVRKILDMSHKCSQEKNLSLRKARQNLASLLSSNDNDESNDDDDDDDDIQSPIISKSSTQISNLTSLRMQNQSPLYVLPTIPQENFQQQSLSSIKPTSSPVIIESTHISTPDNNESGWASPPRTVISHCPSIDQPSNRSSPKPFITTTNINTDSINRLTTIDTDIKPIKKIQSSNILQFFEQCQNELNQIQDEYMSKFAKDRKTIDQEIDLLIDEERQTFDKLHRYINDQRRRVKKRNNNNNNNPKRKYSSSSSTD